MYLINIQERLLYFFIVGQVASVQVIEKELFVSGFQLVLDEGETCEVTKKPRKTILNFPCDPNRVLDLSSFKPLKAHEGDRKETCCYYVEFPSSQLGCPIHIHSKNLITGTFQTTIEAGWLVIQYNTEITEQKLISKIFLRHC